MNIEHIPEENSMRKISLEASLGCAIEESEAVIGEAHKELAGALQALEASRKEYEELARAGALTEKDKKSFATAKELVERLKKQENEIKQLHRDFMILRKRHLGEEDPGAPQRIQ